MTLDTRERLLEAASELIWERSFHAAGVDELCLRADARKGSFYYHFPSKSDLVAEALEWSWQRTRTAIFDPIFRSELGGMEKLRALFRKVDDHQRSEQGIRGSYPGCPFGGVGNEMAHQDERIRQAVWGVFLSHCQYFEAALAEAVAEGTVPPGDLARRSRNIMAVMQGGLLMAKVANDADRFVDAMALMESAARAEDPPAGSGASLP